MHYVLTKFHRTMFVWHTHSIHSKKGYFLENNIFDNVFLHTNMKDGALTRRAHLILRLMRELFHSVEQTEENDRYGQLLPETLLKQLF